jgi:hypothetical protein
VIRSQLRAGAADGDGLPHYEVAEQFGAGFVVEGSLSLCHFRLLTV